MDKAHRLHEWLQAHRPDARSTQTGIARPLAVTAKGFVQLLVCIGVLIVALFGLGMAWGAFRAGAALAERWLTL